MASDARTTAASGAATLGPLNDRAVLDAIRGSYDLGYNDARNARTVPGDSAPGYKGREVEQDHGGALIHTLSRSLAAPAAQEAEPARPSDEYRNNILEGVALWLHGRSKTVWAEEFGHTSLMQEWARDLQKIARDLRSVPPAPRPQAPAAASLQPVAWRYSIGIGKWAATTDEASAWSASFDRRVDALGIIETLSAPGTPAPAAPSEGEKNHG